MSVARLRLARVRETMFPPRAPFFWSASGTSRFVRGGAHGSSADRLLGRKAHGFPTPLPAHVPTEVGP